MEMLAHVHKPQAVQVVVQAEIVVETKELFLAVAMEQHT
jgi:hypothetical protein